MTYPVQAAGTDDGERHQQHLHAVQSAGPRGVAESIGDERFLLASLVLEPGSVFDAEAHEPGEFVELLDNITEAEGVLKALRARTEVSLADSYIVRRRAEARAQAAHEADAVPSQTKIDQVAEKTASRDISMITRSSPSSAGRSLASSRRLVESMPEMLTALTTGKVTSETAYDSARSTAVLDPFARRQVDELLGKRLPDMDGAGRGRWKHAITAAIEAVDAQGESGRHLRARRERNVTVRRGEHGMATLTSRMPAVDAVLMRKRLSLEAERLRTLGDRRGHQAIMADLLSDTVLGREGELEPVTLDVGLIITDRALFNPKHGDVAHIEGYGPVPAEAVREQLRSATQEPSDPDQDSYGPDGPALRAVLRRLYTHPATGELVAVESEARAFPEKLARFLRIRDTTCRGPFCDAPARQRDHIIPHARGGPTSVENGQDTCAHCNQKEEHLRAVRRTGRPGHRVEWISHAGTRRVTAPTPLIAPETQAWRQPDVGGSNAPAAPQATALQASEEQTPAPQTSEPTAHEERRQNRTAQRRSVRLHAPDPEDWHAQDPEDQPEGRREPHGTRDEHPSSHKESPQDPEEPLRDPRGPRDPRNQSRGTEEPPPTPTKGHPQSTKQARKRHGPDPKQRRRPLISPRRPSETTDRALLSTKAPEALRHRPGRGRGIPRREGSESGSGDSGAAAS